MTTLARSGTRPDPAVGAVSRSRSRRRQRGQVLVIFAGGIVLFIGLMGLVIDVSWYWANSLRVQRSADAAALAGAPYLPADTTNAYKYARDEAIKNGYSNGLGSVVVTPIEDSLAVNGGDPRQLDVTVSAPVPTFFMRIFGINAITASRQSKAIYVQPVPMGSPLAYYGVGCSVRKTGATPACSQAGNSNGASGIPDAAGGGQLNSQGILRGDHHAGREPAERRRVCACQQRRIPVLRFERQVRPGRLQLLRRRDWPQWRRQDLRSGLLRDGLAAEPAERRQSKRRELWLGRPLDRRQHEPGLDVLHALGHEGHDLHHRR